MEAVLSFSKRWDREGQFNTSTSLSADRNILEVAHFCLKETCHLRDRPAPPEPTDRMGANKPFGRRSGSCGLWHLFVFPLGVELRQSLPGLTEIAQAGVGIERFKAKRVIQSATHHIEDCFLGRSNRLLAVVHDH